MDFSGRGATPFDEQIPLRCDPDEPEENTQNSLDRDLREFQYEIAVIIYIVILILAFDWQLRNFEVWVTELVWPDPFEHFQYLILFIAFGINCKEFVQKQFQWPAEEYIQALWWPYEVLLGSCILFILLWLDENRRKVYQLILFTIIYGHHITSISSSTCMCVISLLFFMNNGLFLLIYSESHCFKIPLGLRPNMYHIRFHLGYRGVNVFEYGITIQVLPDSRHVGVRTFHFLGYVMQIGPVVFLPACEAG